MAAKIYISLLDSVDRKRAFGACFARPKRSKPQEEAARRATSSWGLEPIYDLLRLLANLGWTESSALNPPSFSVSGDRYPVLKAKRPGVHACAEHPVLLLPSGPDKIWASKLHGSESI